MRARLVGFIGALGGGCLVAALQGQQGTRPRKISGAIAVGEEAVMADTMEAFGQDVAQEAANEFSDREPHSLLPVVTFGPVVFPLEGDAFVVEGDQAAV